MESKKINQLATELAPELSDLTIIGDPTTGISKKITLSQMASLFTGTVEEYANLASFPLVGAADTIYIALDTNIIYRWNTGTSAYVELSPNIVTSLVFNDANGFDGTINLVGSTATLTITTALTTGSVGFIGASGALTQDNSNFFWDNTNKRLGINTNAPTTAIDAFGSGIIGRLNGTSTNNAFLGFASAGSNKWSIGNVQSDHRFRIYSEANTAELVSVLQTGEFGIGIANPLTKLHIFGGASALIANLDANVSVAKSISFRSDNSNRINLEVSGTESGSNAGADLFIRRYSDAGALIDTPLTITRSTGAITLTGSLSGTTAIFAGSIKSDGVSSEGKFIIERDSVATNTIIGSLDFTNNNAVTTYGKVFGGRNSAGDGYVALGTGISNNLYALETGNIGFGTSTPINTTGYIFTTINGTTGSGHITQVNGTTALYCYSNATESRLAEQRNLPLIFETNGSERARFTNSGNFGIGATSPDTKLQVAATGSTGISVRTNTSGDAYMRLYRDSTIYAHWYADRTNSKVSFGSVENVPLSFETNGTERMRITSGGYSKHSNDGTYLLSTGTYHEFRQTAADTVLALTATNASFAQDVIYAKTTRTANSGFNFINFTADTTFQFRVRGDGVIYAQNTTVQSISDIRTKENIINSNDGLNVILGLRPVRFDFKEGFGNNKKNQLGFIAQEIEQVFSDAVDIWGESDEIDNPYKSVGAASLIPVLVKAIQEQQIQIEELKSKIK